MTRPVIDLIYVEGCPNLEATRAALRDALGGSRADAWREWDAGSPDTPAEFRRFGSPTVLVDGKDVTDQRVRVAGAACRTDDPPSAALIRSALPGARGAGSRPPGTVSAGGRFGGQRTGPAASLRDGKRRLDPWEPR